MRKFHRNAYPNYPTTIIALTAALTLIRSLTGIRTHFTVKLFNCYQEFCIYLTFYCFCGNSNSILVITNKMNEFPRLNHNCNYLIRNNLPADHKQMKMQLIKYTTKQSL